MLYLQALLKVVNRAIFDYNTYYQNHPNVKEPKEVRRQYEKLTAIAADLQFLLVKGIRERA